MIHGQDRFIALLGLSLFWWAVGLLMGLTHPGKTAEIIATTCAEAGGFVESGALYCYEADGSADRVVH
jgi:hypothetical protein